MSVEMTLAYDGELRCTLEHTPSKSRLGTDAPADNHGRAELFSPTDLVGAALLSCAVTTMAIRAKVEGIPFLGARGRVVKEMSTSGPRRIARLAVEIEMPAGVLPEHRPRLEEFGRGCPVARSLAPELEAPMTFRWAD